MGTMERQTTTYKDLKNIKLAEFYFLQFTIGGYRVKCNNFKLIYFKCCKPLSEMAYPQSEEQSTEV